MPKVRPNIKLTTSNLRSISRLSDDCLFREIINLDKIIENLYVANIDAVENIDLLKQINAKHIISLHPPSLEAIENFHREKMFHMYFAIKDKSEENIIPIIEQTNVLIEDALSRNETVVVHCMAGISRSVSVIVAYLMYSLRINFKDALNIVMEARPPNRISSPNFGFTMALIDWEKLFLQN